MAVSCAGYNGFISSSYLSINQSSNLNILPDYSYDYGYGSGSSNGIVVLPEYSGSTATQPDAPAVSTPGSSQTAGYINAMYVRFRSGPGSEYSVIGTYNSGKSVTIVASNGEWTACYIDGQMGYVYSKYISAGSAQSSSNNGIVVLPGSSGNNSSSTLPQPDGTVILPQATPQPSYAPVVVVTPQPTQAPVVVVTPQPTANVIPSPTVTATPAPVTTPTTVVTPSNSFNATGYIAGTYVRFRSGPGTNYSIIATYNTGKPLVAHSKTSNGWLLCTIDGVNGYVNENYVLITSNPQASGGSSNTNSSTGSSSSGVVVI